MSTATNTPQPTTNTQMANIQEGALQGAKAVTDTLGNVREGLNTQVKEFSTKASNFSTKEFLESNTLIAKLVFLILVLIGFMILMYLGIALITYFTSSSNSPFLISGLNDGTNFKIIPQDPKNSQAVTLMRSNNKSNGIEFTWSVWLKTMVSKPKHTYSHVFSKGGNNNFDNNGIMKTNNAPGVYFVNVDKANNIIGADQYVANTSTQTNVVIFMNVASVTPTSDINSVTESVMISGVPIGAWFNLVIRLENKVMDVYINGTLTQRHVFKDVPIQNYDDVYVCANGGFTGTMSDLRYFNRSLNVFEINNIVATGPNLTYVGGNKDSASQLSSTWYKNNANV